MPVVALITAARWRAIENANAKNQFSKHNIWIAVHNEFGNTVISKSKICVVKNCLQKSTQFVKFIVVSTHSMI